LSLSLVAATFAVIFIAELPDKSLFASLVLGTRYRALWVWLGVSAAFAVHVVIAVLAGGVLDLLPHRLVETIVAVLFALGAVLLLRPETADRDGVSPEQTEGLEEAGTVRTRLGSSTTPARVVATCFGVVFIGEWGDITQIAIANLTAKYHDPLSVGLGALLALITVAGVAIKVGSALLEKVSVEVIRKVGGTILAGFAVLTVVQLLA
jgi:putative Ca2+/H+ antiporter (TMEM165/GDT1 family)